MVQVTSEITNKNTVQNGNFLLYDSQCPFCSTYVRLTRLRESGINLQILSARDHLALVTQLRSEGFNIDDGMILKLDQKIYHGGAAMNAIALMSSPNRLFNRFNRLLFSKIWAARLIYPTLRAGRNAILCLLGRKKIFLK